MLCDMLGTNTKDKNCIHESISGKDDRIIAMANNISDTNERCNNIRDWTSWHSTSYTLWCIAALSERSHFRYTLQFVKRPTRRIQKIFQLFRNEETWEWDSIIVSIYSCMLFSLPLIKFLFKFIVSDTMAMKTLR